MTDINKELADILDKYYQDRTLDIIQRKTFFAKVGEKVEPAEWHTQAIAKIKALVLESLPEKKQQTRADKQSPYNPKYLTKSSIAYNKCLREIRSIWE